MNQRLLKLFDNNQRVITLTLDFLVTLMMVCLAIALANLGARFYPGWNGAYFPVVAWFISVESLISWNKIRDKEYHEKLIYHLAEWVIIAVFLKALIYIQTSPEQLWIDLVRWQQNIFTFFEGEFLFIFCSLFLMWLFCTNLAGDLANLHTELSDFHWELGQLENDRQSTRLRLAQKVFNSGLVLIITTLLTRADLRQVFGESPASQASTANVLAFFLFALIFFSLTQYAMLHGRWFWNKTPISPQIGKNWIRYSVIFLLLIVVIAFLLPTRYTYGLLEVIQTGISILLAIALFLINLVIFPFLLLFSLLGGKKPTGPTLPQLNIPEITPPGVEAAPALWWEFTKSIFFWVAFLGIIGFAFWYYLRQNPALLQSIRKFPGLRILFSIFSSFFNWVKGINNQIANTISQNMERLRKRVNQSSLRQASRWFDFRRLSPRQKVMYYYLKMIDHSAESGWKRAPYQTPAQFEHDLKKGLPDVEQEVEGITAQFVEARYSQHPIPEDRTNLVQLFWRKIIRALRSSSSRKKPKPPQA